MSVPALGDAVFDGTSRASNPCRHHNVVCGLLFSAAACGVVRWYRDVFGGRSEAWPFLLGFDHLRVMLQGVCGVSSRWQLLWRRREWRHRLILGR